MVMCSELSSADAQAGKFASETSTYCSPTPLPKSQKSAPVSDEQAVLHPPVQPAVALSWQSRFAWAVQLPLQVASHCAVQVADGAVPLQLTSHWFEQPALHCVTHVVSSEFPLHSVAHEPLHSVTHSPEQLKVPGSTLHFAPQVPEQLPVQVADADPVQLAEMLAVQLTGVHMVVHPPDVS
jgi:hypothetical protein